MQQNKKRNLLHHNNSITGKIALVCMAKEELGIEEWILYYRKLGFDKIIIYQNDWECGLDFPFIQKIQIPGAGKHLEAYNDFVRRFGDEYSWAAFFDCDEFLVLKRHNNIRSFLSEYFNKKGIAVNWRFFGSCGQKTIGSKKSVLKRFIKTKAISDVHVKVILNLEHHRPIFVGTHHTSSTLFDTSHKIVDGPFNSPGPINVAQLNHYYFKSYEEWVIKCYKPRSDGWPKRSLTEWVQKQHEDNAVVDLSARDFLYPLK